MTKYLNFFESESGFTEAVESGELFFPNVSYTEDDDTVHWKAQSADPVETPMLRMHFITSTPGQEVALRNHRVSGVTAIEIDGTPVDLYSGGTYSIESPGSHTAVYQFSSSAVPRDVFWGASGQFDAFTSAEITSAVTSIGVGAFENCGGLSGVSIPDSVTAIGDGAFENSGLRYITIKDTVTWLGAYAFKGCAQMRSARIGSGITSIPNLVFADCTLLQSVTLPDNLMQIGHTAFSGCSSLHDISIPSGVTRIEHQAFMGCSGLTAVYFNPETPPTLGADALDNTNNCPIYVPASSVETYQQAWPEYASRIRAMHRISASVNDDSLGRVNVQTTASEAEHIDFDIEVFDEDVYQISSVTVTDGNGDEVECNEDWENHYSFTMPASDVTISVVIEAKRVYSITASVNDEELGEVNGFDETVLEGRHVEFDVEVFDEDVYQISSVTVTDGNGVEIPVTDEGDTIYSFTMPASNVTIFVTFGEIQ